MEIILDKGYGKAISMELKEYKGSHYLQIMERWKENPDDDWKFSKKNLSITATTIKPFLDFLKENEEELLKEIGVKPVPTPKVKEEE